MFDFYDEDHYPSLLLMKSHPWLREKGDEDYLDGVGDSMVEPFEETHEFYKRYFPPPVPRIREMVEIPTHEMDLD